QSTINNNFPSFEKLESIRIYLKVNLSDEILTSLLSHSKNIKKVEVEQSCAKFIQYPQHMNEFCQPNVLSVVEEEELITAISQMHDLKKLAVYVLSDDSY